MLHSEMRRLSNADLLTAKRIRSEILFKEREILLLLGNQARGFVGVLGNDVEEYGQYVSGDRFVTILDDLVRRGVEDDRVVRDRIGHPPVVCRSTVAVLLRTFEFSRAVH